jgi:hypothetical protein
MLKKLNLQVGDGRQWNAGNSTDQLNRLPCFSLTYRARTEENMPWRVGCLHLLMRAKIHLPTTKYQCVTASSAVRRVVMPEQARPQPALIEEQPAVLGVGDRKIRIDPWPLARTAAEHRTVELTRTGDSLVIEPQRLAWAKQLLHPLVLIAITGAIVSCIAAAIPLWLALPLFGTMFLLFVWVQLSNLQWIRFDRKENQLAFERRTGFRNRRRVDKSYPLDAIRAVQLLYSGHHSITESYTDGGGGQGDYHSHREFHGYELNLILDDSSTPRLHLLCLADWKWIRETGRQIGEFLGVSVIDKLYHGG